MSRPRGCGGGPLAALLVLSISTGVGGAQTTDQRAADAYRRAQRLEAAGDRGAALALLWEAAGHTPRDADIQNALGEALERVGALDAAVEAYRAAVSARPAFRKATNNLILALGKAGRSPEAVALARVEAARHPRDPDRHFTLGLAESEADVDQAIRSFQRVLELSPRHGLARYNLALVLKRADRLTEALEELERVLEIEPRAEAHYTHGVILWHQGDADGAAASLRAAVAMQPEYADAHHTLGAVLQSRGDLAAAASALRRALALRPDMTSAHLTLARVLGASGDVAASQRHLAEAERLQEHMRLEQEARTWTSVGTVKLEAGDAASALEYFRRATEIFDGYAPAYFQMGRALQHLGRIAVARAAYARAQQLNPSLISPLAAK